MIKKGRPFFPLSKYAILRESNPYCFNTVFFVHCKLFLKVDKILTNLSMIVMMVGLNNFLNL